MDITCIQIIESYVIHRIHTHNTNNMVGATGHALSYIIQLPNSNSKITYLIVSPISLMKVCDKDHSVPNVPTIPITR